jgi:superfamily I DNA and/or RNA helicase
MIAKPKYRMHDAILGFSNHRFYKGLLSSHPDNAGHLVRNDSHPLVFIDTAGCGFEEEWQAERQSCANPGEFFILREHILLHRENYLGASIGILSPYAEQVRHIRDQISDDDTFSGMDIEVNTIDGFQGQEKDIVYLSLVRSNEKGEIGFLKDERRLNVALTRARKKMIVIGDSATLAQHGLFSDFIEYNELHGLYDAAWNYMS